MSKLIICMSLVFCVSIAGTFIEQVVQPQVASDIALGQLEMSDRGAAVHRATHSLLAWRGIVQGAIVLGIIGLCYKNEFVDMFKQLRTKDKGNEDEETNDSVV